MSTNCYGKQHTQIYLPFFTRSNLCNLNNVEIITNCRRKVEMNARCISWNTAVLGKPTGKPKTSRKV